MSVKSILTKSNVVSRNYLPEFNKIRVPLPGVSFGNYPDASETSMYNSTVENPIINEPEYEPVTYNDIYSKNFRVPTTLTSPNGTVPELCYILYEPIPQVNLYNTENDLIIDYNINLTTRVSPRQPAADPLFYGDWFPAFMIDGHTEKYDTGSEVIEPLRPKTQPHSSYLFSILAFKKVEGETFTWKNINARNSYTKNMTISKARWSITDILTEYGEFEGQPYFQACFNIKDRDQLIIDFTEPITSDNEYKFYPLFIFPYMFGGYGEGVATEGTNYDAFGIVDYPLSSISSAADLDTEFNLFNLINYNPATGYGSFIDFSVIK